MARLTIHVDELADAAFGVRAICSAAQHGHDSVIFAYGDPETASVFVQRTATGGYTARVSASPPQQMSTKGRLS